MTRLFFRRLALFFELLGLGGMMSVSSVQAQVGPGLSMVFNSAGARLNITNATLAPPWTVEVWVKRQQGTGPSAPLFAGSQGGLRLEQYQATNRVGFTQTGVNDFVFDYTAPTNEWVHLTFVGTDQETCLLVNGTFHSCLNIRSSLPLNYFGSLPSAPAEQLRAEVDELRVWQKERSEADVRATMRRRLQGNEPGLVGYWNFDNSSATVASNQVVRAAGVTNLIVPEANLFSVTRRLSSVLFAPEFAGSQFVPGPIHQTRFEARVHPGNLPTTVQMIYGGTLTQSGTAIQPLAASTLTYFVETNSVLNLDMLFALPGDGRVLQARLVASNAVGVSYSDGAYAWSPILERTEPASLTLECSTLHTNHGVRARSQPIALATGLDHSLALGADGLVRGWGSDSFFAISPPREATNLIAIDGGEMHSLALRADGRVFVWGMNALGALIVPAKAVDVTAIAAGPNHNLALRRDGTVIGWGKNEAGQASVPSGLDQVIFIAAGRTHSLAVRGDGRVVGWGDTNYGMLNIPAAATNVVAVGAGDSHSAALTASGRVLTWGNETYAKPNVAAGITNAVGLCVGAQHVTVLLADGRLVAWGDNQHGQLNVPAAATNIVAFSSRYFHGLAMGADGSIAAWGQSNQFKGYPIPAKVRPLFPVVAEPEIFTATLGQLGVNYFLTNAVGVFGAMQEFHGTDSRPPRLKLTGFSYAFHPLKEPYLDPGCTAFDDCDGPVNVVTNGTVDVTRAGHYTLTYEATDSNGWKGSVSRVVVVYAPRSADGVDLWTGGNAVDGQGYWMDPGNWSLQAIPNYDGSRQYSVLILGNGSAVTPKVIFDYEALVKDLTLNSAQLWLTQNLWIMNGAVTNSGVIHVGGSGGSGALLVLAGQEPSLISPAASGGPGQIRLEGGLLELYAFKAGPGSALHNGFGHEISGGGTIRAGTLINDGSITADGPASPELAMNMTRLVNRGVIQSVGLGRAVFHWNTQASFDNTNGLIVARDASTNEPGIISIGNTAAIGGGMLAAVRGGFLFLGESNSKSIGSTFLGCQFTNDAISQIQVLGKVTFQDCEFQSPLVWGDERSGNAIYLSGSIRNHAEQRIGTVVPYAASEINLSTDTLLEGPGTLRLGSFAFHLVRGDAVILTNGIQHILAGTGRIFGNGLSIVNDGLISADVAGQRLRVVSGMPAVRSFHGTINRGELRASGGGRLEVVTSVDPLIQHDGVIRAVGVDGTNRSTVVVSGSVDGAGSWRAEDGGQLIFSTNSENVGWGPIDIGSNSRLELNGQSMSCPVIGHVGSVIDLNGVSALFDVTTHGQVRMRPEASLLVWRLSGDGLLYDPASSSAFEDNWTWVEDSTDPVGAEPDTAGVMRFDRVSVGVDSSTLVLDLYGPVPAQYDRLEVRSLFVADGTALDLRFHYEPSPADVFTLVQATTPGTSIIPDLNAVSFGHVTRRSPDLGYYHGNEFEGDLHILPDRIYLTNVRRLRALSLSAPYPQVGAPKMFGVNAMATAGQRLIWQESATMLPGTWHNVSDEILVDQDPVTFLFNAGKSHRFFRAVHLNVPCDGVLAGLVHAWHAADASDGIGTNGATFLGGLALSDGRFGAGFAFDGLDDRIYLGAGSIPAGSGVGGWTVSLWVRRVDSLDRSSALLMNSTHALKLEQWDTPDRRLGFSAFGVRDFSFPFTVGPEWTHLVFMDTTKGTQLFVNGVPVALEPTRIPLPLEHLGGPLGDRLRGSVDEVLVFDRELSPAAIQNLFQGTGYTSPCALNP